MLDDLIKELESISPKDEVITIKRKDLPDFCIKMVKLVKGIYKDEKMPYEKMYQANIKLVDEVKTMKQDIKKLLDYIKGNVDLEEQVEMIKKVYKK